MTLKLSNLEAVAVMTALQHYLKEVEKMAEEKGVETEKKTIKGFLAGWSRCRQVRFRRTRRLFCDNLLRS